VHIGQQRLDRALPGGGIVLLEKGLKHSQILLGWSD
jgi:hypothetical protein